MARSIVDYFSQNYDALVKTSVLILLLSFYARKNRSSPTSRTTVPISPYAYGAPR